MDEMNEKKTQDPELPEEERPADETLVNETLADETLDIEPPDGENVREEASAEPTDEAKPTVAAEEPAEKITYRWNYSDQYQVGSQNEKKSRRSGAWTYAWIMTALFAMSFVILIAVLLIGGRNASANYLAGNGTRVIYIREDGADGPLTPGEIYAMNVNSVVTITASGSSSSSVGAGVVMTSDGYIITNYHVVKGAHSINVGLYSGESFKASLVGAHPEDDLALLKIKAHGLDEAEFADSDLLLVGDSAYAIGHPGGLDFAWTFTGGYVSAVERDVMTSSGFLVKVVQTDASVNTGNSGGPLLDAEGRVIGIVSMKLTDGYDGIGFAIPSNHTLDVMNDIIENGSDVDEMALVNRPVIGITGVGVTEGEWYYCTEDGHVYVVDDEETALAMGCYRATHTGVWVITVSDTGSAKGVLLANDVITSADGIKVTAIDQLIEIFSHYNAGDQITITFWRNGAEQSATLTLVASAD